MSPIASDLSYEVLQRRRLLGELAPQISDDRALPLYLLPSARIERRAFIADPNMGQPDAELVPVWAWHGRGKARK